VHAYKEITINSGCVSDSTTITPNTTNSEFSITRNDTGFKELIDSDTVEGMFSNEDDRCPIETYTIHNEDGTDIADTDDLYTKLRIAERTGNAVEMVATYDLTDGMLAMENTTFVIRATAVGGSTADLVVTGSLVICSTDTISLVNETYVHEVELDIVDPAVGETTGSFDFAAFF
jgi:hypothetical protein